MNYVLAAMHPHKKPAGGFKNFITNSTQKEGNASMASRDLRQKIPYSNLGGLE
jgi:hypothetical protein